jgi:hypothetical protein
MMAAVNPENSGHSKSGFVLAAGASAGPGVLAIMLSIASATTGQAATRSNDFK